MTSTKPWPYPQPCRLAPSGEFLLPCSFRCNQQYFSCGKYQAFQTLASRNRKLETCHFTIITQARKKCFFPFFHFSPSRLSPLQIRKYPEQHHVSAGQQCKTVTCKSTPNIIISINGSSLKIIIIKKNKKNLPTSLKIVLFLCNYLQMAISGAGATAQLTFSVCQEFFTTCYTWLQPSASGGNVFFFACPSFLIAPNHHPVPLRLLTILFGALRCADTSFHPLTSSINLK